MPDYRRTGTYVAFHADGKREPTESDIKYYRLLQAWRVRDDNGFSFVDSHTKNAALRNASTRATVMRRLKERLLRSKNMILIVSRTTRFDTDWVPFEIAYAIDKCKIPIIAAYPGFQSIMAPAELRPLWPAALTVRILLGTARVIHVPFRKGPLQDAVAQFTNFKYPKSSVSCYDWDSYVSWGLLS